MAEIERQPKPPSVTAREIAKRIFRHENAVLAGILIALVAGLAAMTRGLTVSRENVTNIMLQSSARGMASIGQAFVILTGNIDIAVGGMALVSAVLGSAMMTSRLWQNIAGAPVPMGVGVLVMLLAGCGLGMFNALFVSRLRVPSLIVTLAMWRMSFGGAYQISAGNTIIELPRSLAFFGQGYIAGVPVSVIMFVAVAAVAYFILYHTTYGRSVYAVGGNPVSAWLSGITVPRVIFSVFVISGFLAALAAVITTSRCLTASMVTLKGLEIDSIAAVCIGGVSLFGGRGSLIGVIIGVIIIGVINNGMNVLGVEASFQELAKGAIILSAVTIDVIRRR